MKWKSSSGQQFIPMNNLVPEALDRSLNALGEGSKKAVVFTLEKKYGVHITSPVLTLETVSKALLDLFGQDGGTLLLESLWVNLEDLAEHHVQTPKDREEHEPTMLHDASAEEFNRQVSSIFAEYVFDMFGNDVYTWLEAKARERGTTLKSFYFEADRISAVLWDSLRNATALLLDNFLVRVSVAMGVGSAKHFSKESSLKATLDKIRQEKDLQLQ